MPVQVHRDLDRRMAELLFDGGESLATHDQERGERVPWIAVLVGLIATRPTSPAHAQNPPPRIGWLSAESEPDPFLEAFREGLQKLGYVEGKNIVLDIRHAHGNLEALRARAAELAQSKVVLIVASLTLLLRADQVIA